MGDYNLRYYIDTKEEQLKFKKQVEKTVEPVMVKGGYEVASDTPQSAKKNFIDFIYITSGIGIVALIVWFFVFMFSLDREEWVVKEKTQQIEQLRSEIEGMELISVMDIDVGDNVVCEGSERRVVSGKTSKTIITKNLSGAEFFTNNCVEILEEDCDIEGLECITK